MAKRKKVLFGKPLCQLLTIKGKGVSFMEGDNKWHGGGAIKEFAKEAMQEVKLESK